MKPTLPNKFKTPENYFDNLEKDILAQTIEVNASKVIPLYRQNAFKVAMSIAASVLLIVGIWFFNQPVTVTQEDQDFAQELVYDIYFEDEHNQDFVLEQESVLVEYVGLSNP